MNDAEKFSLQFQKRDQKPPSSESSRREKASKIFGQRSPRVLVTYNRRDAAKPGSLSPDLIKKFTADDDISPRKRATFLNSESNATTPRGIKGKMQIAM